MTGLPLPRLNHLDSYMKDYFEQIRIVVYPELEP